MRNRPERNVWQKMLKAYNNSRVQLKQTRKKLMYTALEQVINEKRDGEPLLHFLKEDCGFSFRFPNYQLLLLYNSPEYVENGQPGPEIHCENWEMILQAETASWTYQVHDEWTPHWHESVRALIEGALSEMLRDSADCVFLRADRDLCCILNYPETFCQEELLNTLRQALEEILDQYEIALTVAVSEPHTAFCLLDMYDECKVIHDYGWNQNSMLLTSQSLERIVSSRPTQEAVPGVSVTTLEHRFQSFCVAQDFYHASKTLDSINQYLMENHRLALETLVEITVHRLRNVLTLAGLEERRPETAEVNAALDDISTTRSFPALQSQINDFFAQLDDTVRCMQKRKNDKVESVLEFIEQNYRNPGLGATMICERLRISSTYLSRLMKQHAGVGVVEAIHTVRLREACRLLTETELSLDQISENVGFSNRWILMRSFKSHFGMTPSEYRTQNKTT